MRLWQFAHRQPAVSGEPAHSHSLARAFAVRTQSMEVDEGSDQTSDIAFKECVYGGRKVP